MKNYAIDLADLVDAANPDHVLQEVRGTLAGILTEIDLLRLEQVFLDVRLLFAGMYPGYSQCNTRYHDLEHTTDTLLAMARLIHGALEAGRALDNRIVYIGLVSALMHDTGYIQRDEDRVGTGAKYTASHIFRSINFAREYLLSRGYSRMDYTICRNTLLCTSIKSRIGRIAFCSEDSALIGKMLGTADLLGQMASCRYLEKLPYLFLELVEGGLLRHGSEYDFLENTAGFYRSTLDRFSGELGGVFEHSRDHFRTRWGIDRNLYLEAIEMNISYLESVLQCHPGDYRAKLKLKIPGKLLPTGSVSTGWTSPGFVDT